MKILHVSLLSSIYYKSWNVTHRIWMNFRKSLTSMGSISWANLNVLLLERCWFCFNGKLIWWGYWIILNFSNPNLVWRVTKRRRSPQWAMHGMRPGPPRWTTRALRSRGYSTWESVTTHSFIYFVVVARFALVHGFECFISRTSRGRIVRTRLHIMLLLSEYSGILNKLNWLSVNCMIQLESINRDKSRCMPTWSRRWSRLRIMSSPNLGLIRLLPIWPHRATLYQPELPFQIVTSNLLKK